MTSHASTTARQPSFERVSTIFERVKTNVARRSLAPEFAFGIPELDQETGGLIRGKVSILAARTSEGKTSLAMQTALNLADGGKTVAFISLEDDRESLVEKLYCNLARVDNQRLRQGDTEALNAEVATRIFPNLKLLVLDDFGYNFDEIERVVTDLDPRPDLVFLDYVQMIDQTERQSEYEAVSRFVRESKVFAEQHDIGLVLVSQINRAGAQDGRPQLHHLANCGRLEQVANLVLLMYAPHYYGASSWDYAAMQGSGMQECPSDYVELEVAKNKTGPRGVVVPLRFVKSQYRFESWAQEVVL